MVRLLYALQCVRPDIASTYLVPCAATTMQLAVFPVLYRGAFPPAFTIVTVIFAETLPSAGVTASVS